MLEVLNISKSFNRKQVLNKISFALAPGTLTGIIGENGAGKSTLLKIIIGELSPDHGAVHLKGKVGYCPQESLVFPTLTVLENFLYFASAYGLANRNDNNKWTVRTELLIDKFGLSPYAHQCVNTLSGGTRQKLNLSISLLHDPDICILDEPYGGFDWETYQHFWELIVQLKDEGKTILLITHLLNDLKHFDRLLTLKDGQII
jgi:ABC-2 type transport system ATP-binding protein